MQLIFADGQNGRANNKKHEPSRAPATVILPICQELGVVDGRTRSVVKDMARKSLVVITMTMSIGVNTACPVIIRPIANKSTCPILLMVDRSV